MGEVKRGNINMQNVVKEFAEQSQVYRTSRKHSKRSSVRDINSILAPASFRSNSTSEKENNSKENNTDSHKVVQIEEGVDKKMKKKGRSFEEGMEGDVAVGAITVEKAISVLKEENDILKQE